MVCNLCWYYIRHASSEYDKTQMGALREDKNEWDVEKRCAMCVELRVYLQPQYTYTILLDLVLVLGAIYDAPFDIRDENTQFRCEHTPDTCTNAASARDCKRQTNFGGFCGERFCLRYKASKPSSSSWSSHHRQQTDTHRKKKSPHPRSLSYSMHG